MNWKLLLVLGVACIGLLMAGLLHRADETLELTLLHTNDLHAHYDSFLPWGGQMQGGVARLKTVVDGIREERDHVLFVDAGDQFQGTLFFTVGGAAVVADVMNTLGYDAMAIGNHEFDRGPSELADFIWLADFPVLSANTNASAEPLLAGIVFPFAVYEFDDRSVGIMGLTTEHTSTASSPGPNVAFDDATVTAQAVADAMAEGGVDIIIALTHLGHERDLELARRTSGIDVIVGGHSHTALEVYPTVVRSASAEPVLVVTAGDWGRYLGAIDVAFGPKGVVEGYEGEPLLIDEAIEPDPELLALLDLYRPQIETLMRDGVGSTDVVLNGAREDVRARETNLGDLICDAMIWKTRGLGATIAIQNGGGIRGSIGPGEITMGAILEVLPFGNRISTVTLPGRDVRAALEHGVSAVEDRAGRFAHVGGLRFTYDPERTPGERVGLVEVWAEAASAFVSLEPDARYTVATNSYLADGGDGYAFAAASERYDTGWLLSDVLAEYVEARGSVSPTVEGRIRVAEAADASP